MQTFTVEMLLAVTRECAGEPDETISAADVRSRTFRDLGYDSVALIEVIARLSHEFDLTIPDDVAPEDRTPENLVDLINAALTEDSQCRPTSTTPSTSMHRSTSYGE
ncbi:acyl carrier protein [Amycolatopsis decaplanina]|uniref:Actinorhodin polyketide synthase ACP n=1 Tax=Amycolatopsis decaplanina DSM 44594 TaxID=1284240 RepID=M2ZBA3_9PSEU|nr:acyl carrier protein [Amycolatopsis decaplanina]EME57644.1 actinorhodin polyketide synthase ACP [Amycolatopsis decaplanina DSM 44594]